MIVTLLSRLIALLALCALFESVSNSGGLRLIGGLLVTGTILGMLETLLRSG